jgi:hypothetical protein
MTGNTVDLIFKQGEDESELASAIARGNASV